MAGEEGPTTESGLFELDAVVVGQPKRSRWRRYVGPALAVSTAQGTPLAWVRYTDDTYSVLTTTSGEFIVRIEQFGPAEFRFTDAADREVGTAGARGFSKTRQLRLQTEQGRRLFLTRPGLLYIEWHLTETDPEGDPAPEILGRVTVSTIDSWIGLQQYVVEMGPRLDASERRTVVASVVCLHLLRRPPGASTAPA
ncbi:hypothetical protein AB0M41_32460 [Streptomyces sp. NPDC051896]|uniref:hypothetical protein n=1 Tax=Streptomyces sp. NPDC051896 TaxID=3155416 RepID=UPI003443AEE2